ncbi:hypothetical protein JB92DRAFT_2830581 [Gautieria morchelliformis]|nr:hypothetical protein JB92DRAFT_2830581 [Gautieria morchelliformis]
MPQSAGNVDSGILSLSIPAHTALRNRFDVIAQTSDLEALSHSWLPHAPGSTFKPKPKLVEESNGLAIRLTNYPGSPHDFRAFHHSPGTHSQWRVVENLQVQDQMITLLYNDILHPDGSYISTQYTWRSADGPGNSSINPELGKANTPTNSTSNARSVQQLHPQSRYQHPGAPLTFDMAVTLNTTGNRHLKLA